MHKTNICWLCCLVVLCIFVRQIRTSTLELAVYDADFQCTIDLLHIITWTDIESKECYVSDRVINWLKQLDETYYYKGYSVEDKGSSTYQLCWYWDGSCYLLDHCVTGYWDRCTKDTEPFNVTEGYYLYFVGSRTAVGTTSGGGSSGSSSMPSTTVIVAIVVPAGAILIIVSIIVGYKCYIKNPNRKKPQQERALMGNSNASISPNAGQNQAHGGLGSSSVHVQPNFSPPLSPSPSHVTNPGITQPYPFNPTPYTTPNHYPGVNVGFASFPPSPGQMNHPHTDSAAPVVMPSGYPNFVPNPNGHPPSRGMTSPPLPTQYPLTPGYIPQGGSTIFPNSGHGYPSHHQNPTASYPPNPNSNSNPNPNPGYPTTANPYPTHSSPNPNSNVNRSQNSSSSVQPKLLQNIQKLEPISQGNFGSVWKGLMDNITIVALKSLHKDEYDSFVREASILEKLQHKNIVQFYGVATLGEENFIVMEYISKGSLLSLVQKEKLPEIQMLSIAIGIAEGMNFLVSQNVVHRDLAARNILITKVEEFYTAKVTDFGLAKSKNEYNSSSTNMLPYKWAAPETLQSGKCDYASDVWSFGVVLYEMFNGGAQPYGVWPVEEVRTRVLNGYTLQSEAAPAYIASIMAQCFELNPAKRPSFQAIFQQLSSEFAKLQQPTTQQQTQQTNYTTF